MTSAMLEQWRIVEGDGRFRGGARGMVAVSRVSVGARNHLRVRVTGRAGSLAWRSGAPDRLMLATLESSEVAPVGTKTDAVAIANALYVDPRALQGPR